jgi:hypothetical protein
MIYGDHQGDPIAGIGRGDNPAKLDPLSGNRPRASKAYHPEGHSNAMP